MDNEKSWERLFCCDCVVNMGQGFGTSVSEVISPLPLDKFKQVMFEKGIWKFDTGIGNFKFYQNFQNLETGETTSYAPFPYDKIWDLVYTKEQQKELHLKYIEKAKRLGYRYVENFD